MPGDYSIISHGGIADVSSAAIMDPRESAALRQTGKKVFLVEPKGEDIRAMGFNYMSVRRMERVAATALRTTTGSLRDSELGRELRALPRGEDNRLRRPAGDPST